MRNGFRRLRAPFVAAGTPVGDNWRSLYAERMVIGCAVRKSDW